MAADIPVRVLIDAVDNASKRLDDVEKKLGELGDQTGKTQAKNDSLTSSFIKSQLVVDAFYKGIDLLKGAIVSSLDSWGKQEDALKQTEAVLKSTQAAAVGTYEKIKTGSTGAAGASQKLRDSLAEATARLHDMQKKAADGKPETESFTVSLQKQQREVEALTAKVNAAGDVYITKFHPAQRITMDEVVKLSEAMQAQTTYADEMVLSAENVLLTFTNIGKNTFPEATKVVLDLSTAMHQDLQSSAVQVGKALQDPILGVSALRRVGVNFSEDQQNVIEKLVKTGNTLEAQKMILKELNTEFGGSAAAAAETYTGKMKQMENQIDGLKEKFGKTIADAIIPFATELGKIVSDEKTGKFFDDLDTGVKKVFTTDNVKTFITDVGGVGEAFAGVVKSLDTLAISMGGADGIMSAFSTTLKVIGSLLIGLAFALDTIVFTITMFVDSLHAGFLELERFMALLAGNAEGVDILTQKIDQFSIDSTQKIADWAIRGQKDGDIMLKMWSDQGDKVTQLPKLYSSMSDSINTTTTGLQSKMAVTTSLMSSNTQANFSAMSTGATAHATTMQSNATTQAENMQKNVNKSVETMSSNAAKNYSSLEENASKSMSNIKSDTETKAEQMHNNTKGWFDKIVGFLSDIISKAGEALAKSEEARVRMGVGRQFGGGVSSASQYTVGEAGMEGFTPQVAGYITPHGAYMGEGGGKGGGTTVQFIINAQNIINSPNERRQFAEALYHDLVVMARSQNLNVADAFGG